MYVIRGLHSNVTFRHNRPKIYMEFANIGIPYSPRLGASDCHTTNWRSL